jgi:hypothetical protein
MRRWEGVIYLVLALIGGEYIALRGLLTVPKSLTSWALTNVFSTSNAPVPQQVFQYALHAVQPLCRPGYVGCEWDAYVAAHAMASAVWGIIITMVMLAMTKWSSLAPSRGGVAPRNGVLCVRFINSCFTAGVFNNPAIGRVTIETPQGENPPLKAGRGSST